MLPERLVIALALISTIVLIYIGDVHEWTFAETMIAVLAGILGSSIVGRILGRISARELAKSVQSDDEDSRPAKDNVPGTE